MVLAIGIATSGCVGSAAARQARAEAARVEANLATFDDLDFNVFSNQKWSEFHRSHAQDVVVHWPDGRTTRGLDVHIADLETMFVWAPDTRIEEHPVRIGQGEWTAVIGIMKGTFTQPMPIGDALILPTGKAFELQMVTVGHWNSQGVMDEEYLFWDNLEFMRQIGVLE
jgi:hypothetical protein